MEEIIKKLVEAYKSLVDEQVACGVIGEDEKSASYRHIEAIARGEK